MVSSANNLFTVIFPFTDVSSNLPSKIALSITLSLATFYPPANLTADLPHVSRGLQSYILGLLKIVT